MECSGSSDTFRVLLLILNWSSDQYKTTQYSVSISIWDHNLETDHATQFVKQKSDLFITDESFHDFVHSVVCPLHDEIILLYYDMTTRGSTLNELLAAIAARHSPVLSAGELSGILPSGQSNGKYRYWYWYFLFLHKARQITSNSHTSKARVKNFRVPRGSTHTAKPHTNITTCHVTLISYSPKEPQQPPHNLPTTLVHNSTNTSSHDP